MCVLYKNTLTKYAAGDCYMQRCGGPDRAVAHGMRPPPAAARSPQQELPRRALPALRYVRAHVPQAPVRCQRRRVPWPRDGGVLPAPVYAVTGRGNPVRDGIRRGIKLARRKRVDVAEWSMAPCSHAWSL